MGFLGGVLSSGIGTALGYGASKYLGASDEQARNIGNTVGGIGGQLGSSFLPFARGGVARPAPMQMARGGAVVPLMPMAVKPRRPKAKKGKKKMGGK